MFPTLAMKFFWQNKIRKLWTLEKLRNYDEKGVLFQEKTFSSFWKPFFYENEKAHILPVVAGRLVSVDFTERSCWGWFQKFFLRPYWNWWRFRISYLFLTFGSIQRMAYKVLGLAFVQMNSDGLLVAAQNDSIRCEHKSTAKMVVILMQHIMQS